LQTSEAVPSSTASANRTSVLPTGPSTSGLEARRRIREWLRKARQALVPARERVAEVLGTRVALYRHRRPVYQTVLLQSLRGLWDSADQHLLDVGGGTGLIAQAIHELFPIARITSIDVEDRFLPGLSIETATFDGTKLPFPDASFDCVLLSNVLHHVPETSRVGLLLDCSRVDGGGRLYIKDHLATNALDRMRLAVLDYVATRRSTAWSRGRTSGPMTGPSSPRRPATGSSPRYPVFTAPACSPGCSPTVLRSRCGGSRLAEIPR
jgi:SAM-dependent methyltransferase